MNITVTNKKSENKIADSFGGIPDLERVEKSNLLRCVKRINLVGSENKEPLKIYFGKEGIFCSDGTTGKSIKEIWLNLLSKQKTNIDLDVE